MVRGFFGNLVFAIIARMLCGNHLNHCYSEDEEEIFSEDKISYGIDQ